MSEGVSEAVIGTVYRSSRGLPLLFARGELWKVDKNVLYNIQEFQTWANDLKRRGPAGLRDLPCFPDLPLPSSQCCGNGKKHLNSQLLWKRVGKTALAPASCAAGCSFVRCLPRRNHYSRARLIARTHMGVCSRRVPEATPNSGLTSL